MIARNVWLSISHVEHAAIAQLPRCTASDGTQPRFSSLLWFLFLEVKFPLLFFSFFFAFLLVLHRHEKKANLQGTLQEHDGRLSIAALVDVSERADALPC